MRKVLSVIRPDERRAALGALLTLFGVMCGHGLLETARDALFLATIPASRLPWVYLGIAGLSLLVVDLKQRFGSGGGRRALTTWLLLAAGVTLGFWFLTRSPARWVLYALYVWSGVLVTLVVVRFWTLMGDLFTATQAKRLFAVIGTGSVLGAIAGTGLAGLLATLFDARVLVLASALVMAASATGALLLPNPEDSETKGSRAESSRPKLAESVRTVFSRPYASRVAFLVLVSTVAVTIADYVFKSTAASHVEAASLGTFFATVYFGLNLLSLGVQLTLVGWLVRRLNITAALAILPALLLGGAAAFVVLGGLVTALAIKGADGALRHSLHRTVTELLYVPWSERMRQVAKGLIDVLGQRGGQALASVVILAVVGLGLGDRPLGVILGLLSLLWALLATELKPHYVEVFRRSLRGSLVQTRIDFPDLDIGSLESLIAALNSDNDGEVVAAMELLAGQGKARLIPALILYHPSPKVVIRAVDLFVEAGRTDFVPVARRLGDDVEPRVRAAVVRALVAVQPDPAYLRERLEETCPVVRATALVCLVALEAIPVAEANEALDGFFEEGPTEALLALARTLRYHHTGRLDGLLSRLARHSDMEVRLAAAEAMAEHPAGAFQEDLLEMLAEPRLRQAARQALLAMGEASLDFLALALADLSLPPSIRVHLPRTISRFDPHRASRLLLRHLPQEPDGMVRFKILRGLGQIRLAHPEVHFERRALQTATEETLSQVFRMLDWRMTLERAIERSEVKRTRVQGLLVELLADKEAHALDRLFRLLALQFPADDIKRSQRGLNSRDRNTRSASRELLEHLLPLRLREAVLGLVDDVPDVERLARAGAYYEPMQADYETVLRHLLASPSESLRSLAVYHIGELDLSELKADVEAVDVAETTYLRDIIERVVGALRGGPPRELAYEG